MNVLSLEMQVAVIGSLCEGLSIRAVERLTGVHRDTIMRLGARVGAGCAALHDTMFCNLNTAQIQIDELWAFIGKKQRRLKPTDAPELGDCYSFLALDATGKAIISYRTGKRDGTTAREFLTDLRTRVLGSPILSSDGFSSYAELVAARKSITARSSNVTSASRIRTPRADIRRAKSLASSAPQSLASRPHF
jgi:IS1 family transposase